MDIVLCFWQTFLKTPFLNPKKSYKVGTYAQNPCDIALSIDSSFMLSTMTIEEFHVETIMWLSVGSFESTMRVQLSFCKMT